MFCNWISKVFVDLLSLDELATRLRKQVVKCKTGESVFAMSGRKKEFLSLTRFLLRQQSLKLYRDLLRTIKKVPDENHRIELKKWVRQDFENNRHLVDEELIKMNISRGRLSEKELKNSLQLAQCM